MLDLLGEAQHLLPEAIQLRRSIHVEPELGLDLPLTQARTVQDVGLAVGSFANPLADDGSARFPH